MNTKEYKCKCGGLFHLFKEERANLAENIQNKSGRNANFAKKEAKTTMERIARFNKIKKSNYK